MKQLSQSEVARICAEIERRERRALIIRCTVAIVAVILVFAVLCFASARGQVIGPHGWTDRPDLYAVPGNQNPIPLAWYYALWCSLAWWWWL